MDRFAPLRAAMRPGTWQRLLPDAENDAVEVSLCAPDGIVAMGLFPLDAGRLDDRRPFLVCCARAASAHATALASRDELLPCRNLMSPRVINAQPLAVRGALERVLPVPKLRAPNGRSRPRGRRLLRRSESAATLDT